MINLKVTIWNEYRHEQSDEEVRKVYPDGLHAPIAAHLCSEGSTVRVATADGPRTGRYLGLDDSGRIMISSGASVLCLWSGDVEKLEQATGCS